MLTVGKRGLFGLCDSLSPFEHLDEIKTDNRISGFQVASPKSSRTAPLFTRPIPVVCEGLVVLCIQGPCSRKHDGGVQVSDDPGHSSGSCDTCLGPLVPSLES